MRHAHSGLQAGAPPSPLPTPTLPHCPSQKRTKTVHRRDTNPEVPFSAALDKTLTKLRSLSEVNTLLHTVICCCLLFTSYRSIVPQATHFQKPVSAKHVPDYYTIIKFPMDLQTIKEVCTATPLTALN